MKPSARISGLVRASCPSARCTAARPVAVWPWCGRSPTRSQIWSAGRASPSRSGGVANQTPCCPSASAIRSTCSEVRLLSMPEALVSTSILGSCAMLDPLAC
ncbi:hypothetical protein [Nonomuraea rubra]|uniref:hypothetical protein n=1 Tax=Nonomuraea rubra TaxID=46180 RepID=UPI0036D2FC49